MALSGRRPVVWVHAFSSRDPSQGFLPPHESYLRRYFDVVTTDDLIAAPDKMAQVSGALVQIKRFPYLKRILPYLTNLRAVASFSVGVNHIDFQKFADLGVKVANTPDVSNPVVAELAMALLLASARNLIKGNKMAKEELEITEFNRNFYGVDVEGSTIGIVGMGGIGTQFAIRAKAFGAKIVYHNRTQRSQDDERLIEATYIANLHDMFPMCDFVVITCPLTSQTRGLIGREEFSLMKPSATVLNIARGPIIDSDALVEALSTNHIRGAALDVTDPEPLPRDHALRSLDNVIITPHWGSQSKNGRFGMFKCMVDNLKAILIDGKPMPNEVRP